MALASAAVFAIASRTADAAEATGPRVINFQYQVVIPATAADQKPVDVFVPIPRTDSHQKVLESTVEVKEGPPPSKRKRRNKQQT